MMRSRRRGTTLAECLIVITMVATVMGTVSLALHSLFQADRRARDTLAQERSLDRFVAQLRSDAHQAVSAKVDKPSSETDPVTDLRFVLPEGETIQYTIHAENIERVVRRNDSVQHRESYLLPASTSGWQVREDGTTPIVSLVLALNDERHAHERLVPREYRVDAAVNLIRPPLPASED